MAFARAFDQCPQAHHPPVISSIHSLSRLAVDQLGALLDHTEPPELEPAPPRHAENPFAHLVGVQPRDYTRNHDAHQSPEFGGAPAASSSAFESAALNWDGRVDAVDESDGARGVYDMDVEGDVWPASGFASATAPGAPVDVPNLSEDWSWAV